MNFNKIFQSKTFQITTWALAGLIALLLVFKLGISVGYRKAQFSYRWGDNYHRNFGGPRGGFLKGFLTDKKDFIESHGAIGQIIKMEGDTIIMRGRDDIEKIILVKNDTTITRFREKIDILDLQEDDFIVVLGQPNDNGQIEAKLIRVMPSLPEEVPQAPDR